MHWTDKGLIAIGLTSLMAVSLASQARADLLGRVIVGGVTNQALTEVTEKDCPNATGAGADACDAADAVVDVHRDVSHAVNQVVQNTCQNASGVGEDACQGIDDVNSFKRQLSEQVSHIHLFGSSKNDTAAPAENAPSSNPPAATESAPTQSAPTENAPTENAPTESAPTNSTDSP